MANHSGSNDFLSTQSTDQGTIFTDSWKGKVSQALLKEDKIIHYVESDQPPLVGTLLKMILDWARCFHSVDAINNMDATLEQVQRSTVYQGVPPPLY